jgi:hypothetical protein
MVSDSRQMLTVYMCSVSYILWLCTLQYYVSIPNFILESWELQESRILRTTLYIVKRELDANSYNCMEHVRVYSTVAHKCNVNNKSDINLNFITSNSNSLLQIQIPHYKFKFLTPNSNSSLQIQIPHSKFKFLTRNSNFSLENQISHYKIQISHSKFKFFTPNSNSSLVSGNNLK